MRNNFFEMFFVAVISCMSIFMFDQAYSAFSSSIAANTDIPIAKWEIKLNDENIVYENKIGLEDVVWEHNNANEETIAPGSKGLVNINVDTSGSDVAVKFDISFFDSQIDANKILTITDIKVDENSLIKTSPNTYSGVFTLEEIQNKTLKSLSLTIEWINDEINNDRDSVIGLNGSNNNSDFIEFNFVATQYSGEEIIPYGE